MRNYYTVNGCGIDCEVRVEDRVKRLKLPRNLRFGPIKTVVYKRVYKANKPRMVGMKRDRYIYQVVLEHNHPVVELNYLMKSSPVLMCVPANEDNSEKESSTLVVEVDLQTGEIIDNALRHYFGSFRSLQRETIATTMNGKNVLTILGTGGSKSLTYLLPAVISSKPTVVVSLIKSLIDDFLSSNLNIAACKISRLC